MEEPPLIGTCWLMCSLSEIEMRQKAGLVHILESSEQKTSSKYKRLVADRHKMVKKFSRSAAGRDMLDPQDLRPAPVLKKTINYLLSILVCESRLPYIDVHEFICDRLRAIRQDMVIQQLSPATSCAILEPIVRFHAYSAYRLCEQPFEVFDPVLNQRQLNECLKQLLVCYDTLELADTPAVDQMEALYGILHLGDNDALFRMLSLTTSRDSLLTTALGMSLADSRNDYVSLSHYIKGLPPLLACVAAIHLPRIRRRALMVMNNAYSSKNLRFPISLLQNILMFDGIKQTAEECQHYGLTVDNDSVQFLKGSFDLSAKEKQPTRMQFIDDNLDTIVLPDLLLTPG